MVFSWVHNRDLHWLESFRLSNDNIKLGVTSMGQNIPIAKHCKALRMHCAPKINETELLCNTLMLQKNFWFKLKLVTNIHFSLYLKSLDLWTLNRKLPKDEEIKKPTKETKNQKNYLPFTPQLQEAEVETLKRKNDQLLSTRRPEEGQGPLNWAKCAAYPKEQNNS